MIYFTSLQTALDTISQRTSSSTFGLKLFKQCMEDLGNPQYKLNCVHVAGTNGKGSTSSFIATIAQESGLKVGLYTSPYLIHHNDRFRINGQDMSDEDLLKYINMTTHLWDKYALTMFEIDTLIAIWYFQDQKVDLAVFEVGLGGRLDATNVILPLVSVITTIGFDHMDFLGDRLDLIAFEKAGIIKENTPIISYSQGPLVDEVFERVAHERKAPYILSSVATQKSVDLFSQVIEKEGVEYTLSMNAKYQCINASLAIDCAQLLMKHYPRITQEHIHAGLKKTVWFGRFQKISESPLIIIDGAHNINGMEALVQSLSILPQPIHVLFSAIMGKDHEGMLEVLQPHVASITVTEFDFYRKQKASVLAINEAIHIIEDPHVAYLDLRNKLTTGTGIICGSLYFLSYILNHVIDTKENTHEPL
ncbi:MAG: bifunctional folylpolyglutamate synthase/dihydrofolate synthase [Erysipelothrix sp.]|nr:bifunctional folylpolyglutamate synthase/dihydrofolate synthase [Erysipelothrix sp.]